MYGSKCGGSADNLRPSPFSSLSSSSLSSPLSYLTERAGNIDALRGRVENELDEHVHSLGRLLGSMYKSSDATMRGRCRRWMGGWLRDFAYGGCAGAG